MSRVYTGTGRLFQEVQAVELDGESLEDIRRRVKLQPHFLGEPLVVIGESNDFAPGRSEKTREILALDVLGRTVLITLAVGVVDTDRNLGALQLAAQTAAMAPEELGKIARSFISRTENDNISRAWDEMGVEMNDEAVELSSLLAATFNRDADDYADTINCEQRIIIAAEGFNSRMVALIDWLVNNGVNITGLRYRKYLVGGQEIFFAEQIVPVRDPAVDAQGDKAMAGDTLEPWRVKGRQYYTERLSTALGARLDELLAATAENTFSINWAHKYYFWLRGAKRNFRIRSYARERLEIGFYNAAPEAVEDFLTGFGLGNLEVYTVAGYTDSAFVALTAETRFDERWRKMLNAWLTGSGPDRVA